MAREVIGVDGTHYRLDPHHPWIVQAQDKTPPYRFRRISKWADAEQAAAVLAGLGRLVAEETEEGDDGVDSTARDAG